MNNREFFRPRGSTVAAYIAYALLAGMTAQSLYTDGLTAGINAAAWCTALGGLIFLALHRPAIEIFDEGVRIRNPLSTVTVGWHDVDVIEAKYTAFLQLRNGQKISIWCAQAPGSITPALFTPAKSKACRLMDLSDPVNPHERTLALPPTFVASVLPASERVKILPESTISTSENTD